MIVSLKMLQWHPLLYINKIYNNKKEKTIIVNQILEHQLQNGVLKTV